MVRCLTTSNGSHSSLAEVNSIGPTSRATFRAASFNTALRFPIPISAAPIDRRTFSDSVPIVSAMLHLGEEELLARRLLAGELRRLIEQPVTALAAYGVVAPDPLVGKLDHE